VVAVGERVARLLVMAAAAGYLVVLFVGWFDNSKVTGHAADGWSTVGAVPGALVFVLLLWQALALFDISVGVADPQPGAFVLCEATALSAGALMLHLELRGTSTGPARLAPGGWIAIFVLAALALAGLVELLAWRARRPEPERHRTKEQYLRLLAAAAAVVYLVVLFLPWYRYDQGRGGANEYIRYDGWDSGGYWSGVLVILLLLWQGLALLGVRPGAADPQSRAFVLAVTAAGLGGALMYEYHKGPSSHFELVYGGWIAIFVSSALVLFALIGVGKSARTRRAA
jgi:hypothetical protein